MVLDDLVKKCRMIAGAGAIALAVTLGSCVDDGGSSNKKSNSSGIVEGDTTNPWDGNTTDPGDGDTTGPGDGDTSQPPCTLPECGVYTGYDWEAINADYNTLGNVMTTDGDMHSLSRFSAGQSPIFPSLHINNPANRMVFTLARPSTIYSQQSYDLVYFNDINKVERDCDGTKIFLKDGDSITGVLTDNTSLTNIYPQYPRNITGIEEGDSVIRILEKCVSSISMDLSDSISKLEDSRADALGNLSSPKTIELMDGNTLSSDLSYIVDMCGHWGASSYHERLLNNCEILQPDGTIRTVQLGDLDELEFTGVFDAAFPSTREAIIKYKDGIEETVLLNLTSESYNGVCLHDIKGRDFDGIIVHNKNGARFERLNNVKRIRFHSESIDPAQTIQNTDQHEGFIITSWQKNEYMSVEAAQTVKKFYDLGAESVFVLVTLYQDTPDTTDIYMLDSNMNGTPTDQSIGHIINDIKSYGMRPAIKLHVDCLNNEWRGLIGRNFTEEQKDAWFDELKDFQVHYAQMSERLDCSLFVFQTELEQTVQDPRWTDNIAAIRAVYSGEITASLNHDNYWNADFIDLIDLVGISEYSRISNVANPPLADLVTSCETKADEYRAFCSLTGKRILFTEMGFQSRPGTTLHPWWTHGTESEDGKQEQANGFAARFMTTHKGYDPAHASCFAGYAIWDEHFNMNDHDNFGIMSKPAENVVDYVYRLVVKE